MRGCRSSPSSSAARSAPATTACAAAASIRVSSSPGRTRTAVMGGAQAAKVMDIVNRGSSAQRWPANDEALTAMSDALKNRLDRESTALFGTARLWDDGIIDPRDTRACSRCAWRSRARGRRAHAAPQHLRHRPHVANLNPETFQHEVHTRTRADRRHRPQIRRQGDQPYVAEWEAAQQFPAHTVFKKLGDLGLLGIKYPVEYGGMGLDFSYSMVMAEALGDCNCGGVPMAIGAHRHAHRRWRASAADELRASSSPRRSPETWSAASASASPAAARTSPR